jgi:formylglycine-generating enzyme required for sulfatase activity
MKYGTLLRIVGLALGTIAATKVAQNGFAIFLSDFLSEVTQIADVWLAALMKPLEPLVAALFAILKKWELIQIPRPREHWRQVLVLTSLLLSNYVRGQAHMAPASRTIFIACWAGCVALFSSLLSGMVTYADIRIGLIPLTGICVFFLGVRFSTAAFDRTRFWRAFGYLGVGWLFGSAVLVGLLAISVQNDQRYGSPIRNPFLDWLEQLNASVADQLPSPGLTVLVLGLVVLALTLTFVRFRIVNSTTADAADVGIGIGIGRNILIVLSATGALVVGSRLQTALEPPDPTWDIATMYIASGHAHTHDGPLVPVQAFRMGVTEVTVAQFRRFVQATQYQVQGLCGEMTDRFGTNFYPELDADGNVATWQSRHWAEYSDTHPVICISFHDAQAFARWLSDKTKRSYRLPTDLEWERAATGDQSSGFRWDVEEICEFGNLYKQICPDKFEHTAPVASRNFRSTGFGLRDMLGNVSEWTSTCYEASCGGRMLRGGGFSYDPAIPDPPFRGMGYSATLYSQGTGFRVARTD